MKYHISVCCILEENLKYKRYMAFIICDISHVLPVLSLGLVYILSALSNGTVNWHSAEAIFLALL